MPYTNPHVLTLQVLYILTIPSEILKKLKTDTEREMGLEQPLYKEQLRRFLRLIEEMTERTRSANCEQHGEN